MSNSEGQYRGALQRLTDLADKIDGLATEADELCTWDVIAFSSKKARERTGNPRDSYAWRDLDKARDFLFTARGCVNACRRQLLRGG